MKKGKEQDQAGFRAP